MHGGGTGSCGYLFDESSRTLLCGDLITQPGASGPANTEDPGVVESVAALEAQLGAFAKTGADARRQLEGFAQLRPELLASMHGSAYRGDGEKALRELATALGFRPARSPKGVFGPCVDAPYALPRGGLALGLVRATRPASTRESRVARAENGI
jgi:hypothetical protein